MGPKDKEELMYTSLNVLCWSNSPWSYLGSQVAESFIIYNSLDCSALCYGKGSN